MNNFDGDVDGTPNQAVTTVRVGNRRLIFSKGSPPEVWQRVGDAWVPTEKLDLPPSEPGRFRASRRRGGAWRDGA